MEQNQASAEVRELTFGEQAVGLTFNPSGNSLVDDIKRRYAEIIDLLNEQRKNATPGAARHYSVAITDAETAQMRAVRAMTFQY